VESDRLTVAMPTCDGARHVADALRGILAQPGAFDIVVSDDRSNDETLSVVRSVAGDRARIHVNSERLGLAGNWNRCVELSSTPWVATFHQDDVMLPGHIEAHLAAIAARPDVGMVGGSVDVIDDAGEHIPPAVISRGVLGPSDRTFEAGSFVAELAVENPVRCSAVTLARAAHAKLGGFDPDYRYAVDWEFWLRLARKWAVAWLAQPTVAVRWHPGSETHRFKRGTADLDEVSRLLAELYAGRTISETPRLRRLARRNLSRAYTNRAYEAARAGDRALVRTCLARALGLAPMSIVQILADPRLAARLLVASLPARSRRARGRERTLSGDVGCEDNRS
jgi:glycosyltransferase involved in cell wall biosynthesis